MGPRAGAERLAALGRDLRRGARALLAAPRFALPALLALSLGAGTGIALLPLVQRGLAAPAAVESPAGAEVRSVRAGTHHDPTTLQWMMGHGRGFGSARQTPAEAQRAGLDALLRTLGAAGALAVALSSLALGLLLLVRASVRRREMALRAAAGATRGRLLAGLLAEAAPLVAAGAVGGLLAGAAALRALRRSWPAGLDRWLADGLAPGTLALALAVPLAAALLGSLLPLLRHREARLREALAGGSATTDPREGALRRRLSTVAVAASLTLLTGAGLLFRTFASLPATEGMAADAADTLTLELRLPGVELADAERTALLDELVRRVEDVPGARRVALSTPSTWIGLGTRDLAHAFTGIPGRPGILKPVEYHAVSPGYFAALGVALHAGRDFQTADGPGAPPVAVVSESFAYRLFPRGTDPIGKLVQIGGISVGGDFHTIVGVVADVRVAGLGEHSIPVPALYLAARQAPPPAAGLTFRGDRPPAEMLPAVRGAVRAADARWRVDAEMTLAERRARARAPLAWLAVVFGALAAAAAAIAATGLYGVISYNVAQRTREIGVRMALGAPARRVVGMVVLQGIRLTGAGLVAGGAGALCMGRLLQYLFHGVQPLDPVVLGGSAALLALVAVLASAGPARAAARIAPAIALRHD